MIPKQESHFPVVILILLNSNANLLSFLFFFNNVQMCISSVQSLDRLGHRGNMRDDSAEILLQSFMQNALVNSSGMGRDVHSLMLSAQHLFFDHGVADPPRSLKDGFMEAVAVCGMPQMCVQTLIKIIRPQTLYRSTVYTLIYLCSTSDRLHAYTTLHRYVKHVCTV